MHRRTKRRLLVLGAGTGQGNNLIRALRAGGADFAVFGGHHDRFALRRSAARRNWLIARASPQEFLASLRRIVAAARIDLVVPNSEADVAAVSAARAALACRVFLPSERVIDLCQDKYQLAEYLRARGLPVPRTRLVTSLGMIAPLFRRLGRHSRLWCRIRKGSGSVGTIPVRTASQARHWIRYWQDMRGVPPGSFTISEYLPGRDLCVQCLYDGGRLVMAKMHERLSYFTAGGGPSGVSSTAALAKMICEPRLLALSARAIRALDARASGVFFVDLKEDAGGEPRITEINAGRFANVPTIHDAAVAENMARACARVAFGERLPSRRVRASAEDWYVMRELDALPVAFRAGDFFGSILDSRK